MKKQHPGVVLMFEVGYKCLFFEEDAEVRPTTVAHSRLSQGPLDRPQRTRGTIL